MSETTDPTAGERVHWIGEYRNTLHGNGAGSKDMEHVSGDEDEVTCRLCLSLLAREDVREQTSPATPDAHDASDGLTEAVHEALAIHFVMWHDLPRSEKPGGLTPSGEWRCACGLKFGFSDSGIAHQAAEVERIVAARVAAAEAKGRADAGEEIAARVADYDEEPHSDECGMGACVRCVVDEFASIARDVTR